MKINTVLMRGVNDDEAPALLRFALDHGYELRFIEQMPLDAQHAWDRHDDGHRGGDPGRRCEPASTLLPDPAERGGAPAETWLVAGLHRRSTAGPPGSA